MKYIFLFLAFLIFGCSKPTHNLNIYLLEKRVNNKFGITIDELINKKKLDHNLIDRFGKYTTFDTINNSFIYAGEFEILNCKLKPKPFILDSEINFLDLDKNKISFTKSAEIKIGSLSGKMREGIQFVITDNNIPIFGGHFWNTYSSYRSNWNSILYTPNILNKESNNDLDYSLIYGMGMTSNLDNPINFKKYPELIKALKETNRLKE